MHPYSTDSQWRITVPLIIGGISLLLVQNVAILYDMFPRIWFLEGWVPSFGLVTTILYYLFSRWLWRLPIFRYLGLVKVPDLNGTWEGKGTTYRPDEGEESEFVPTIQIKQNWQKLSIRLETDDSISRSKGGILLTADGVTPTLTYHYSNQPHPSAPETMHTHRGTATLDYMEESDELTGRYYTDEERRTYGDLHLERTEKTPLISSQLF